ncbi:unnamed protein product [Ectocarpus sp. 12 AP-2014]
MWDVIFSPGVADVFQTPFQDAPLDLDFCPLFYLNRRTAVDARLAELRAASAAELVALVGDAWLANAGTVCRGLNWDRSSVRHLQAIAAGLGGPAMAAVLAALCLNHKHFGGGLPDLLLMRAVRTDTNAAVVAAAGEGQDGKIAKGKAAAEAAPPAFEAESEVSTPAAFVSWLGIDSDVAFDVDGGDERPPPPPTDGGSGQRGKGVPRRPPPPPFKAADMAGLRLETWLLEVKGPSDRLSDRQTAWLRILDRGRALVGVCHVTEGAGGSHVATATTTTSAIKTGESKHEKRS